MSRFQASWVRNAVSWDECPLTEICISFQVSGAAPVEFAFAGAEVGLARQSGEMLEKDY
jgi:hypothetical protein